MKKMMLALLAAAAAPAAALAVQPAGVPEARVHDRQGEPGRTGRGADRIQTRATIDHEVRSLFARLDRNRDGSLMRDEIRAGRPAKGQRAGPRGQRRAGAGSAAFDRLDRNRDGLIDRQEFGQAQVARQQRRAVRLAQGGRGMHNLRLGGRMFEMADVNRDARVSIQEATAAAYRRFDMSDVNRDGQLTPQERWQSRETKRLGRQRS